MEVRNEYNQFDQIKKTKTLMKKEKVWLLGNLGIYWTLGTMGNLGALETFGSLGTLGTLGFWEL